MLLLPATILLGDDMGFRNEMEDLVDSNSSRGHLTKRKVMYVSAPGGHPKIE
jgi:hypothetical protein